MFIKYIQEILEPYGIDKVRAMFGGFGIYKNSVIIGIVADGELYFKADLETISFYKSFGSTPFTYEYNNKKITMNYSKVIPEVLENFNLLEKWIQIAYNCGLNSLNKKSKIKKPKNNI